MSVQVVKKSARRSRRTVPWLAWSMWILSVATIIAEGVLGYFNDPSISLGDLFYAVVLLAFATVSALVASRRPENLIGWLLSSGTLLISLGGSALEYAVYTLLTAPHSHPGGEWMLWFGAWVRTLGFSTLVIFVPLFFPNGRLPSLRWRRFAWFAVGIVVLSTFAAIFAPTNESELRLPPLPNPLGIALAPEIGGPLEGITLLGSGAVTLIVAASVVLRFRHAEGEERQQLKWFAYAGVLAAVVFAIILIGIFLLPPAVMVKMGGTLFSLLLAGFPIAVGIAILKYRLYEIDLLINRTLVYVPLTAILAGIFAASITLSQKLFVAITGATSDAAAVLTTLIVVALFEPLKAGLQHLVDRRFKEAPDPAKKLKAYGDQVDGVVHILRADTSAKRLLDEAMSAFDIQNGAVFLKREGEMQLVQQKGVSCDEYKLSVPLSSNGKQIGTLSLGARRDGSEYSTEELVTLQETANSVAAAIALTERVNGEK